MDYKELIEYLNLHKKNCGYGGYCILCKCLSAVETLLAERDEAMKYIPKVCSTCKHWDAGGCNAPITGGECAFDLRQAWKWRGLMN